MVESAKDYDLFVSYAEGDRAWVEGYLLDSLKQAEINYFSEAAFTLGAPRLREFERAIQQVNAHCWFYQMPTLSIVPMI
jgi:hypothetical protein